MCPTNKGTQKGLVAFGFQHHKHVAVPMLQKDIFQLMTWTRGT